MYCTHMPCEVLLSLNLLVNIVGAPKSFSIPVSSGLELQCLQHTHSIITKSLKTKQTMASNKNPLKIVFIIVCSSATLFLTTWCIYKYHLDLDVTIVSYKRLHESIDDIYPSISLCFYQPYVENHFQRYGIHSVNSTSYINFLKGDFWSKEFIGIDYDNVTLNFKDYFLSYDIFENFDRPRRYTFDAKQIEKVSESMLGAKKSTDTSSKRGSILPQSLEFLTPTNGLLAT